MWPKVFMKIAVSRFARERHTPSSPRDHFMGTWEELIQRVEANFEMAVPGYRPGVCLVPVAPEGFQCSTIEAKDAADLVAVFEARREGEIPFLQVRTTGEKSPAHAVDIILYRQDVLAEGGERSSDAEWEIVSIQARLAEETEPMNPVTMARNFLKGLGLPEGEGGSAGVYTAEEFARAIIYWSTRVKVVPRV